MACVGDVQGLPVSRGSLLENLPIEGLLGNHHVEPRILVLQSFQLLGHLWLYATILMQAIMLLFREF